MEHLARIAEIVLALFGTFKFAHEIFELGHWLLHLRTIGKLLHLAKH